MPRPAAYPAAVARVIIDLLVGRRCLGCADRGVATPCPTCIAAIHATPPAAPAAFVDAGPLARLVRTAKRGDWRAGGAVLGAAVAERWVSGELRRPAVDLVTWVPPDPRRRRVRGGHLPEQIGRALAAHLAVDAAPLLRRAAGGTPQRGLTRSARLHNVDGAFTLRRPVPRRARTATRVLLVDDVLTTGATLAAARRVLAATGLLVEVVAVAGVPTRTCRIPARSADFVLTPQGAAADGVHPIERKVDGR